MIPQTQAFFDAQANLLAEKRLSQMVRPYRIPLFVNLTRTGNWHMLSSRHAVLEAFLAKHLGVRAAGVGRLRAVVTREEFSRGEKCKAEVIWFYVGEGGRRLGRTYARYFLTRRPEGLNVEMIEFRRVAFPQINDWFEKNARELSPGTGPRV